MSDPILTFKDRYNKTKDLTVEVRGDFLRIEYVVDEYFTDYCYVPAEPLYQALAKLGVYYDDE